MKKVFGLISGCFGLACCIAVLSCQMGAEPLKGNDEEPSITESDTGFATTAELDAISLREGFVDWKLARVFAVTELQAFSNDNDWENPKVSARPVLIYDHLLSPKYYEFRILEGDKEVGAIACVARMADGEPVKYIMNRVRAPSAATGKGLESDGKIIDIGYPAKVALSTGVNGRTIDPETGLDLDSEAGYEIPVMELLEKADKETLDKLGITTDEIYQKYVAIEREKTEKTKAFWENVDKVTSQILVTTDEEIENAAAVAGVAGNRMGAKALQNYDSTFILYNWWDKAYWYNCGGWCGPYVITFISMGLNVYPGYASLVTGSNVQAIDKAYEAYVTEIGTGPRLWPDLKRGLEKYTDYSLTSDNLFAKSHDWNKITDEIKYYGCPALSLRTWASINGVWTWSWHYRVICGTKREHREWMSPFLWWSIFNASNTDWYLMHDNGSDGGNFWEKAGSFAQFESVSSKHE